MQKYLDVIDKYYGINGKMAIDKLIKLMKEKEIEKGMEANTIEKISQYVRLKDFV